MSANSVVTSGVSVCGVLIVMHEELLFVEVSIRAVPQFVDAVLIKVKEEGSWLEIAIVLLPEEGSSRRIKARTICDLSIWLHSILLSK